MVVAGFLGGSLLGAGAVPWQVAAIMLSIGVGTIVFETPNNTIIFANAGPTLRAASAITGVCRFVGLSLGGAAGATLLTVAGGGDVVVGFGRGLLVLAAMPAVRR